jgi:hypothetical protein
VTGSWWQSIDTGEGYTKDVETQARYTLRPVTSGLVGWFEARRLVPFVDGTIFSSIADLTDLHNDLIASPTTTDPSWTLHIGPPAYIVGTNPGVPGGAGPAYLYSTTDYSGRVDRCCVCAVGRVTVAGNTSILAGWGTLNADNYAGPLCGSVSGGKPSAQFGLFPRSDKVVATPPDWSVVGISWDSITQDVALLHDAQIYRATGHAQVVGVTGIPAGAYSGNFGWGRFEIGRGNNLQQIAAALFYLRTLTAAELLQNDAYLRSLVS